MTVKERLIEFIQAKNIKISQFEKLCGMSNGYINSIRRNLGIEKLDNVLNKFPELNREWLLTGKGEMFTQKEANNNTLYNTSPTTNQETSLVKKIYLLEQEIMILKEENHKLIDSNTKLSITIHNLVSTKE